RQRPLLPDPARRRRELGTRPSPFANGKSGGESSAFPPQLLPQVRLRLWELPALPPSCVGMKIGAAWAFPPLALRQLRVPRPAPPSSSRVSALSVASASLPQRRALPGFLPPSSDAPGRVGSWA